LVGFGTVDPLSDHAAEDLKRFPDLGLRGLKIAPIYQYVSPTDDRWSAVFDACEKLSLPVLVHMGATFLQFAPLEYARPISLERWLREFPRLRLAIAHLGHPWESETIVLIRKHPNAFADLSALAFRPHRFADALFTAIEYGVTEKLIFGSDFPVQTTREAFESIRNFVGVSSPFGTQITADDLAPALDGSAAEKFLDGPSVDPLGEPLS
jgi:predicted TIM-barrel fold metal-dependent hydrolase